MMSTCCYICFEPTSVEVCTCELKHAHPLCIIRCIWSSGCGNSHLKCPGCLRSYRNLRVMFFVGVRRCVRDVMGMCRHVILFLKFLAEFPPGTHLAYFDDNTELHSDD